ncbi:MAG: hypothetical protein KKF41_02500 [Actinobacteria bacterium]|nr:hypothetical protein [Actinomycetota bacterium]MBU1945110.1 hypothetical protein [Actinomycetota bacterium]MBU2686439.1 hypothetical protein [Actinomycetota bacterium]
MKRAGAIAALTLCVLAASMVSSCSPTSPVGVMEKCIATAKDVTSYRARIEFDADAQGKTLTYTATYEQAPGGKARVTHMAFDQTADIKGQVYVQGRYEYVYPVQEQWYRFDKSDAAGQDMMEEMAMLQGFSDKATFESQDGVSWKVSATAGPEWIRKNLLENPRYSTGLSADEIKELSRIVKVKLLLEVQKKTYLPLGYRTDTDIQAPDTPGLKQSMSVEFSDVDKDFEIVIPPEALEAKVALQGMPPPRLPDLAPVSF